MLASNVNNNLVGAGGIAPQGSSSVSVGTSDTNVIAVLMKAGLVDQNDFNQAKVEAINKNTSIEKVLIEKGKITEVDLYKAKAVLSGYKFVDLKDMDVTVEILNNIRKDLADKYTAIAFEESEGKVKVAMEDPGDLPGVQFLRTVVGKPLEIFLAPPSQIKYIIDNNYGAQIGREVEAALEDFGDVLEIAEDGSKGADLQEDDIGSAPVAKIVNMILEYAVRYEASDVHIEPREKNIVIRFRISGILVEKLTLPHELINPVVSRIKILSNLKIDEHRLPQDGRFQIKVGDRFFDLRVSIMPCVYGEKVVFRLLERGGKSLTLEQAGLEGSTLKYFKEALSKTEGVILVTGPTGSGKTQTLASSLHILNTPEVNIQTLEDPVEIRIEGITQVQVRPDIGLSFASGLRSFLRQDPDIIMVGEIRDSETASLAIQSALTGHKVLATLHTNSAAGAMPRLLDMGIEPFLLASVVNGALAQRLTRRICPECIKSYPASEQEIKELKEILDEIPNFDILQYQSRFTKANQVLLYKGDGCRKCGGTGYKSRIGIFEFLTVTKEIAKMIMEEESTGEISRKAVDSGMLTMGQDGFLKVLRGMTTMQEVLRVVTQ